MRSVYDFDATRGWLTVHSAFNKLILYLVPEAYLSMLIYSLVAVYEKRSITYLS
jgi:hypothetical protein